MSVDLTKLSPKPWIKNPGRSGLVTPLGLMTGIKDADAEFIALARNAFDVMMRRDWGFEPRRVAGYMWQVYCRDDDDFIGHDETGYFCWPDPFTALVEADKWYKLNIEGKQS